MPGHDFRFVKTEIMPVAAVVLRVAWYETARNAGALLLGLLSAVESKNCWTMAELSGHGTPDKLQHLLSRARWDADDIADDLRDYVTAAFADPDAVLVVD